MSIRLPRVVQQTDSHCGPAVLQLLYAHRKKNFTQDEIVAAARIGKLIKSRGSRPKQLAKAVQKLTPNLQFWFKQGATSEDLHTLIKKYKLPVAINWQGLFYNTPEEERRSSGDRGHYSVVINIDPRKDSIRIADPYPDFARKPRTFSLEWFEKRWWDSARDKNPKSGRIESIETKHFIYILTPKSVTFPAKLGMQLPHKLSVLETWSFAGFFSRWKR
ncbi:MAG: cysteine peptidase family C39 domain-containing protein [Patescibacteria group bacterium]